MIALRAVPSALGTSQARCVSVQSRPFSYEHHIGDTEQCSRWKFWKLDFKSFIFILYYLATENCCLSSGWHSPKCLLLHPEDVHRQVQVEVQVSVQSWLHLCDAMQVQLPSSLHLHSPHSLGKQYVHKYFLNEYQIYRNISIAYPRNLFLHWPALLENWWQRWLIAPLMDITFPNTNSTVAATNDRKSTKVQNCEILPWRLVHLSLPWRTENRMSKRIHHSACQDWQIFDQIILKYKLILVYCTYPIPSHWTPFHTLNVFISYYLFWWLCRFGYISVCTIDLLGPG